MLKEHELILGTVLLFKDRNEEKFINKILISEIDWCEVV